MKREGFTLLNTIITMFIISSTVLLILNFNNYTYNVIENSNKDLEVLKFTSNKITELYNTSDWLNVNDEEKEINGSLIDIDYIYENETEYGTEKLYINITYLDKTKEYKLERNNLN